MYDHENLLPQWYSEEDANTPLPCDSQMLLVLYFIFLLGKCYPTSSIDSEFRSIPGVSFFSDLLLGPSDLTRDIPPLSLNPEYDFVIIGAGTAGSVLANRLTEVAEWKVLLLEAGQDEIAFTDIPFMSTVLSSTRYSWGYYTEPLDNACLGLKNRRSKWPKGRGMGGSSIINGMIYNRGHPRDFDDWEAAGNQGWGYQSILPYFLKSERAQGDFANSSFHGQGGYLDVQRVPHKTVLAGAFLAAGVELGYPLVDYNSDQMLGFSLLQVNMRNGTRCSTNKAFLRPIRKRRNLHVCKFSQATQILIDQSSQTANGVEFRRGGKKWRVHAKKEIIVSAGAINTPQLLMLSGVGPREHLQALQIPLIKHLPGVGENLQDHVAFGGLAFLVNESVAITGRSVMTFKSVSDYVLRHNGVLTNVGVGEAIAFVRSQHSNTANDSPDLELMFGATHLGADTSGIIQRHIGLTNNVSAVYAKIGNRHGWSAYPIHLRPKSRGHVRLASRNPTTPPLMFANYLNNSNDVTSLVEGIKMVIKLSKTRAFQRYKSTLYEFPLPACQHLVFASDEYWECATRQLTVTVHHQCCTTKMGMASDPLSVVDSELRVHGIKKLRVVDASVMPTIPAAHTNAPVIMIAERTADRIKQGYGKINIA